jgi:hypothetical protein
MKKILLFSSVLFLGAKLFAGSSPYSYSQNFFVDPVSQNDGDTISTFQITVATNTTLIDAAEPTVSYTQYNGTISFTVNGDMNRSYRKRTIHNTCTQYSVYIGSNTSTLTSTGFDLVGSSTSAPSLYTTYNRAAIYGQAASGAGAGGCVVTLIKETNSVP